MSSIETSQIKLHLQMDMRHVLNPYQFDLAWTGGALWPDATLEEARAFSQVQCIVKKYNNAPDPAPGPCKAALEKFTAVNRRCGEWEYDPRSSLDDLLMGEFKQALYRFYYRDGDGGSIISGLDQLIGKGKVGKGNSVMSRYPDFYTKVFDGPHSTTSDDLKFAWDHAVNSNPHWRNAEATRQNRYGTFTVAGNKLSFVNKNVDVARCISKEPIINMWFQLGLGEVLQDRLKEVLDIDLSYQPFENGEQARLGSLDGSFATIDLESASDSISMRMLRYVMPREWLVWLELLRSPKCNLPGNRNVSLEMVSTMGNGFTFPLETVIFGCVVSSVYRLLGIPLGIKKGHSRQHAGVKNFGVFGDDIIVKTDAYRWVVRLLELLGFSVNVKKTFVKGPFRESCGQDWFNGQPCRPVFIKRLNSAQDIYVAINTLNRWSAMTKLYLPSLVGWLRSLIATSSPTVPCDEVDTAGIHVPSDLAREVRRGPHGEWNYRKDSPIVSCVDLNVCQKAGEFDLRRVQDKLALRLSKSDRKVNLGGLHVSFIGGYLLGGKLTERNDTVDYRTEHAITPHWDYNPDTFVVGGCRPKRSKYYAFADWSSAVRINLS